MTQNQFIAVSMTLGAAALVFLVWKTMPDERKIKLEGRIRYGSDYNAYQDAVY